MFSEQSAQLRMGFKDIILHTKKEENHIVAISVPRLIDTIMTALM